MKVATATKAPFQKASFARWYKASNLRFPEPLPLSWTFIYSRLINLFLLWFYQLFLHLGTYRLWTCRCSPSSLEAAFALWRFHSSPVFLFCKAIFSLASNPGCMQNGCNILDRNTTWAIYIDHIHSSRHFCSYFWASKTGNKLKSSTCGIGDTVR